MAVSLDLLDLVQVLLQRLARMGRVVPSLRFVDDRHDRLVANHGANINAVVHLAENAALVRILNSNVVQQLQPEGLQFVRVVFEQIEVVAHRGENLIKDLLQLATVFFGLQDFLHARFRRCRALFLFARRVAFLWLAGCRICGLVHLEDKVVLLRILLELVSNRAHDVLNLVLEELLQIFDRDLRRFLALFLNFLLIVQNRDNLRVVVTILVRGLAVVQVYQHVGQVLVQAVLDVRGTARI